MDIAHFIEREIKTLASSSPLNHTPTPDSDIIFDTPLVQFADGDDPIFEEYKKIIDSTHLTPHEAVAKAFNKSPKSIPHLFVISWILPISAKIRESNRKRTKIPSRLWAYARAYGEKFNDALRQHLVNMLTEEGYLAVAPVLQPYFSTLKNEKGRYSNWSERHTAYAAGLGTFSLSDGFITERGIAHRCGSVVTSLALPPSPRTATGPYANCLFYVNGKCRACIVRCPAGAISESGHDKNKCSNYLFSKLAYLTKSYNIANIGCGLCQVKVPCEFRNPTKTRRKTE